jgi:hypothetical protein
MPPKHISTRRKTNEKYGGVGAELPTKALPTYSDVARYFYRVQSIEKDNSTQINLVTEKVEEVWQKSPAIPLLCKRSLRRKVVRFLDKVKAFNFRNLKVEKKKELLFVKDKLFDISACTCQLPVLPCSSTFVNCNADEGKCVKKHIYCECAPGKRVPLQERDFLLDQRMKVGTYGGQFQFGRVDHDAAVKEARRQQREESYARLLLKETSRLEDNVQLEMTFGSEVRVIFFILLLHFWINGIVSQDVVSTETILCVVRKMLFII